MSVSNGNVEFVKTLDVEPMEPTGSRLIGSDTIVDGDDAHWLDDVTGIEKLTPDTGPLSTADRLRIRLAGAPRGKFAHWEDVAADAN